VWNDLDSEPRDVKRDINTIGLVTEPEKSKYVPLYETGAKFDQNIEPIEDIEQTLIATKKK
jgi:hypothetical protein